ncbi:MAG: DUF748 domain-containing protein [Candidatus Omnitrophica bacterium]|nr:DUF748 domain-containing protein [Candidatus Omnitrophota bacterium]
MMKRWLKPLGIVLLVLVLIAGVAMLGLNLWLAPYVRDRLETQVQLKSPFELEIGSLSFAPPVRVVLKNVVLKDKRGMEPVFSVAKVDAAFQLGRLLKRQIGLRSLSIEGPEFTFRRPKPRPQVGEPSAGATPAAPAAPSGDTTGDAEVAPAGGGAFSGLFIASLVVRDGEFTWLDPRPTGEVRLSFKIKKLTAQPLSVPGSREPVHFELSSVLQEMPGEPGLKARGWFSPQEGDLDIRLSANDLDLRNLSPYYNRWLAGTLESGKADLELSAQAEAHNLDGRCHITIRDLNYTPPAAETDLLGVPSSLFLAYLARGGGRLELDIPIRGRLDRPQADWGPFVKDAFQQSFRQAVSSDIERVLGAGSRVLGGALSGEGSVTEKVKRLQEGMGGLMKDLLGTVSEQEPAPSDQQPAAGDQQPAASD